MKSLVIHPEAASELEMAVVYYENKLAGLGTKLWLEIGRAFGHLLKAPQLCPPHRRTDFRKYFVPRFPYTIFFLDLPEAIWIAAVAHESRAPGYWRARTPSGPTKPLPSSRS